MINRVELSRRVKKQLPKLPRHIVSKLKAWVEAVETDGLMYVRKQPGYHDEPLHGRRRGQRSIRLSIHYRAIYTMRTDGSVAFVLIEEVNKHDY